MDGMSFSLVEAHVERDLKRKRTSSSIGTISDSSSSTSDHQSYPAVLGSSPITAPIFSDEINGPGSDAFGNKSTFRPIFAHPGSGPGSRKRLRAHSMAPPLFEASRQSWKSSHNLPQSSPVYHGQHSHFSHPHGPNLSFASETSTIPDSPAFDHASDNDNNELPVRSFQMSSSNIRSSPPRTPPPTRSRASRHRKGNATGEEGADLLLYLATSPSPANPSSRARIFPPSTPPSNHLVLPSSMMSTPGTGGGFIAGFSTPGQQFNFADFVNVTPSPAQGAFGSRTPGLAKTPLAARETRRRLNFDTLVPPGGSPNLSNVGRGSLGKETGLGMELGGELVS